MRRGAASDGTRRRVEGGTAYRCAVKPWHPEGLLAEAGRLCE